ncbi:hypothetical protein DVA67_005755 [Solirubrobacter sp. CPCC 204708]|uniref:Uncharacterized protein n=1 Tax=Solirubrobacter deserti TaxID=2282478 RepID=A0ABT4RGM2_9ACTN|nr:hypothetical protein [Solirubrobacter deserti]MBE2315470.1 hypothetical protein [Solirubrobacter deserti]MDA0137688.1 hypothetical protein [Solirubrobacter deserti]
MNRRFDIGPFVLALGALLLLVGLFLDWYGVFNAWAVFEIVDLLLAACAVAAVIGAVGLLTPEVEYVDKRALPWLVGVAFVVVAAQLMDPPPVPDEDLGLGAWLALAGAFLMVVGAVLSFSKVSFAVAVEGRDRRTRVAAVDHRPPPTETGQHPVARSSTSLLHPRPTEEDPPEARETS